MGWAGGTLAQQYLRFRGLGPKSQSCCVLI